MKEINLLELFNPTGVAILSLLGDYQYRKLTATEVPLSYISDNQENKKLAFNLYSPQIVEIIDSLTANKIFPYNSVVEAEVEKRLGFKGSGTGRIVYGSQGYVHERDAILKAVQKAEVLKAEGFHPLGNPEEKIRQKFMFLAPGTTWIGQMTSIKKEVPQLLVKDARGDYFFIKRANSRKGIRVDEHTYVKAA
ncbi:MAG: hypothetical protein IM631_12320 [Cytophagales bacterium]|nr:hypothetical protein [Cytophagales bacterium]MCA6382300.1 hypothetical protein [Cytophagales bacterium]